PPVPILGFGCLTQAVQLGNCFRIYRDETLSRFRAPPSGSEDNLSRPSRALRPASVSSGVAVTR
ncbi:hypothetical protein ABLN85_04175, partial [Mycobacterium tuberculosis]